MRSFFLLILFFAARSLAAQTMPPIPERIVSIDCENKRTDAVLQDIAAQGKFEFAWDSRLFDPAKPVTLHARNISVRRAIQLVFGNRITYKVKGNYLVLLAAPAEVPAGAPPPKKKDCIVEGYTRDALTGQPLAHVSVYDSVSLAASLSDDYGHYLLKVSAGEKPVRVKVSREQYADTFFVFTPVASRTTDIEMRRLPPPPPPKISAEDTTIVVRHDTLAAPERNIDNIHVFDSLIGFEQLVQVRNLRETIRKNGQVSLLPYISTNGMMCGTVRNKYSFNVIGGYTAGTDMFELGTGFNIDRGDVKWVQAAGGFNLTGGKMYGVQAAGGANINIKSVHGVQISGGSNIAFDSLIGIQFSGGSNLVTGSAFGAQIAGGANVSIRDFEGIQLAGGANVAFGNVRRFQIAGGANCAGNVTGMQIAGGANIAFDTITGMQVSGGLNFARRLYGAQVGPVNVSGKTNGLQVGIVNYSDTCASGLAIGLVSIVRRGVHELAIASTEKKFLSLSFHTGMPRFYNILSAGIDPAYSGRGTWCYGYGAGSRFFIRKKFALASDLTWNHVNTGGYSDYTNEWIRLSVSAEWRPVKGFGITAGPVLNYYHSGASANELQPFYAKAFYENENASGFRNIAWAGASVSLRFF